MNSFAWIPLGFQLDALLPGLILHRIKHSSCGCLGVLYGKRNLREHGRVVITEYRRTGGGGERLAFEF